MLIVPPDASLTPHALQDALSTVRRFCGKSGILFCLGVPMSVVNRIEQNQSYSSEDEKVMAGLQYYLQTVPGVSWGRIAGVLWRLEEHTALDAVRQYLPHTHGEYQNVQSCIFIPLRSFSCVYIYST